MGCRLDVTQRCVLYLLATAADYFNVLLASFGHFHRVVVYRFDLVGVCGR